MSDAVANPPTRPRRLRTAFERSGERLCLDCRNPQWAAGCFLVLWLTAWTVGCVFLAGLVILEPQLFHFLFAVPFWASWFFVFFLVVWMFFGREQFVLDHEGAVYQSRAVVPLRRRFTPLNEVLSFATSTKVVDSESGRTQPQLEMLTAGRSLCFLRGGNLQELQWLQWQLNEHLDLLKKAVAYATTGEAEATPSELVPPPLAPGEAKALELAVTPVAPPSDSRWAFTEDIDDFRFVQCGRFSPAAAGGLLFINLFWNGIVSVFVLQLLGAGPNGNMPQGGAWWGLFVFLIPFEVIGLAMFAGLLAAMFEPVRRTAWTFARQSIVCRWTWLGVGPAWTWPVDGLARIEIRRNDPSIKKAFRASLRSSSSTDGDGADYRLILVDPAETELCSIDVLTEGEALWMGDIVLRQRRGWFPTNR